MHQRISEIASYLRQHQRADRGALLVAVLDRWPGVSGDELVAAIDAWSYTKSLNH